MESIRSLFRIGHGPSSSHTMGPARAAARFLARHPEADGFRVELYGSLALTGRGHLTDEVLLATLGEERTEIGWRLGEQLPRHPNGLVFTALDAAGGVVEAWTVYSIGGGAIRDEAHWDVPRPSVYALTTMDDILGWCTSRGASFWEYVDQHEGPEIWTYLGEVWGVMSAAIERGVEAEGRLPGTLDLQRKAAAYLIKANASISGAEVGCQGEIGTACAMAAAAAAQLLGGSVQQIEYAAEAGLEHHLGLTCDPVEGYVQIPCIERNAVAASRALQSASFAILSDGRHRISFDEVVLTMLETGRDMCSRYKETSQSGLAKNWMNSETRGR